jgi:hypothetical protein
MGEEVFRQRHAKNADCKPGVFGGGTSTRTTPVNKKYIVPSSVEKHGEHHLAAWRTKMKVGKGCETLLKRRRRTISLRYPIIKLDGHGSCCSPTGNVNTIVRGPVPHHHKPDLASFNKLAESALSEEGTGISIRHQVCSSMHSRRKGLCSSPLHVGLSNSDSCCDDPYNEVKHSRTQFDRP